MNHPRRPSPPERPLTVTTEAAEPLVAWIGGKRNLARRIIARLATVPHRCYAEPFVGMGGIFLRRPTRAPVEVINDRNGEVVNLFRVVREHPDALAHAFDHVVASRAEFTRLVAVPPDTLTDIQRAARFAYLQTLTFAAKPNRHTPGNLGVSPYRSARFSARRMRRLIAAAARRLDGVLIECRDWPAFLDRYDTADTLFYLDPPYWGHETDYGKDLFSREDFAKLAARLQTLQGRFLLSLNDRPETRALFASFAIDAVETTYTAARGRGRRVTELLISGGGQKV